MKTKNSLFSIASILLINCSLGAQIFGTVSPSQNSFSGIGTNSPTALLDIKYTEAVQEESPANASVFAAHYYKFGGSVKTLVTLNGAGQMYLGAISGYSNAYNVLNVSSSLGVFGANGSYVRISSNQVAGNVLTWSSNLSGVQSMLSFAYEGSSSSLSLSQDGRVGIGTTDLSAQHLLSVGGSMIAERVVVKLQSDWPDYVFSDSHRLMSLSELEMYITENKHLPNMPSAGEVVVDGVDVAENQIALLRQLEELTLHVIALSKELEKTKEELKTLQANQE